MKGWKHFERLQPVTPSANGCEECLQMRERWVHFRICKAVTYGYEDRGNRPHCTILH